jgi:hypothetical protein
VPAYAHVHVPPVTVTVSVMVLSVGLVSFQESAGWPIRRKPATSAAAPHAHEPGTRANPDCPSNAAPPVHTNTTPPPTIVAEELGSKRSIPGLGPATVTCRCFAAVRPRTTAAQNDAGVAATVLGRGVVDATGECAGAAAAVGIGDAAIGLGEAGGLLAGRPVGAVLGATPQAAATMATRSTKPAGPRL